MFRRTPPSLVIGTKVCFLWLFSVCLFEKIVLERVLCLVFLEVFDKRGYVDV